MTLSGRIRGGQGKNLAQRAHKQLRIGNMERYHNYTTFSLITLLLISIILSSCGFKKRSNDQDITFNGDRAYQDVIYQQSLGARYPGSTGHETILVWLEEQLIQYSWTVEIQTIDIDGRLIKNLIAKRGGEEDYLLIGTHYDTRIYADLDPNPDSQISPVPGANDGASGVAVLMELARILPLNRNMPIYLVFFDWEDNGDIDEWDWIQGSRAYVEYMKNLPDSVIIVDMIGDTDLQIYKEHNSDENIMEQIWDQADKLGYGEVFLDEYKHTILDDHIPFVEAGIPAVDIIDLDYPHWHTTSDTIDKISSESLKAVGDTLFAWLLSLDIEDY